MVHNLKIYDPLLDRLPYLEIDTRYEIRPDPKFHVVHQHLLLHLSDQPIQQRQTFCKYLCPRKITISRQRK